MLSADFELAWAWRYAKNIQNPKEEATRSARAARNNVPRILALCDEYRIPITWATVGHLFLEGCDRNGGQAHSNLGRLPFHTNKYWHFGFGDWFDDDPCTHWHNSPEWYAPDLINDILGASTKHEIGCHTFSHIDCSENICPANVFQDEVEECKRAARAYGIELKSFVYPGNTIGNLDTLRTLGFNSFRNDRANVLGYPRRHSNGLWELPSTAELYYRKGWSLEYHIERYKTIADRAIRSHSVAHFWFHPSCDTVVVDSIIPLFFKYVAQLKKKNLLFTTTVTNYIEGVVERIVVPE